MSDEDLTENGLDAIEAEEMYEISEMIEKAKKHGLLTEVIYTYGEAMANHGRVVSAVFDSLAEWDLL